MCSKTKKYFLIFMLIWAVCAGVAGATVDFPRTRACLDRYIRAGIFDGAVLIVGDAHKNIAVFPYGTADRNTGRKMTADTVFDISSISKPMGTATCMLLLAEQNKLDVEKDFTFYLKSYTGKKSGAVSIRDLACHYSGIAPDYPKSASAAELKKRMLNSPFPHKAGTVPLYSCVNYHFMGFIIENVSGMPLGEFAQKNLFLPLNMTDTGWGAPLAHTRNRLVVHSRCVKSDPGVIFDWWARKFAPAAMGNAGVFTTPLDAAKYARMILRGGDGIFKTDIVKRLMYVNLVPGGKIPRSFGWNLDPVMRASGLSDKTIYHSGSSGQSLWIDPGTGRFCLIFTNLFGGHDEGIRARREVMSHFLSETK